MKKAEFNKFFKQYSENVDNSEKLGFWKLTDNIIETYLLKQMKKRKNVTIVDFGGGTGRWLETLDKHFEDSTLVLVDLSEDMLAVAKKKAIESRFKNKIKIIHSDIAYVKELENNSVDYLISTYNPLSFVPAPQKVIDECYRILRKGGSAMITVQGLYNALYSKINNFMADSEELNSIFNTKKVKWDAYVPSLWQLSKSDMEDLFAKANFQSIESRGIAVLVQPQPEDFDPENKKLGPLSKKLNEDKAFYNTVLELELKIGLEQDAVNRAMNILTIGHKK